MKKFLPKDWINSATWIDQENANIDEYVKRHGDSVDFDLHEKLTSWREKGYVAFEQVVPHDLIDALVGDIEYLRKHYRDFELYAELRGVIKPIGEFSEEELSLDGVKFNSIQTVSLAAARLSLVKEVSSFLGHVFQSPACALQSLTFYKGSQQSIHVDYPYVRCQTQLAKLAASWIPLEDIHPESGPLVYYPGSHKTEISDFFDWGEGSILFEQDSQRQPHELSVYLAERMKNAGIEPEVFCPKKGDVFIWHGNLSHEGSKILNEELTRRSYVTHFTSLDAYPPEHKHPSAKNGSGAVVENGGYCFDYPWLKQTNKLPSWTI
ncbi:MULTISPECIES: phytanoyl-CoA dioxygenase family protein [unclassified Undibacterium]|uniref:phytanoyl-CoA dioxygenase family protein n=1 Tax=unclassified Undibacterium TaxID=2630295 RepID=UPI003C2DB6B6